MSEPAFIASLLAAIQKPISEPVFIAVLALASQVPLLLLATLVEWSARKRRPPAARPERRRPATRTAKVAEPPAPEEAGPRPEPVAEASTAAPAPRAEPVLPAVEPTGAAADGEAHAEARVWEQAGAPEAEVAAPKPAAPVPIGLGLRRTREGFLARLRAAITRSERLDQVYEGLEEALVSADVGVETSLELVEAVRGRLGNVASPEAIREGLEEEILKTLRAVERPLNESAQGPLVILLAGVNGAGKTTTIAKLAARFRQERGAVIVAAADTFRAAAIEQLEIWCGRAGAEIIKQKPGADPAAVAFDAVRAAVARNAAVVMIDTAGRLQTRVNLMEELKKIARVVERELPGAPHERWLVLDATTGQNALSQARLFGEALNLSGVVLAKLDSTAKGGVVIAIAKRLQLPVRFVGLGERLEDLQPFDPAEFVEALFSTDEAAARPASGSYAA